MPTKKKPGRPKGSPNIETSELRKLLKELLVSEMKQAEKILEKCTLEQRLTLFNKLGAILVPRQSVEEAAAEEATEGFVPFIINMDGVKEEPSMEPYSPQMLKELADVKKKRAGRPKGSLNKRTLEAHDRLREIYLSEYYYIKAHIKELPSEKRFDFLLKVTKLLTPYGSEKGQDQSGDKGWDSLWINHGRGWEKAK